MPRATTSAAPPVRRTPLLPGWALPGDDGRDAAHAAFRAGAALKSLDDFLRDAPVWAGAWRRRLALRAAAIGCALAGRADDEAALRDAHALRRPGDALGPGAAMLEAWRGLAERTPTLSPQALASAAARLSIAWQENAWKKNDWSGEANLAGRIAAAAAQGSPLAGAAAVMAEIERLRPDARLLAWWAADQTLALRLSWTRAVPLLILQARNGAFVAPGGRRRLRPGEAEFEAALGRALARACFEALQTAEAIAVTAERLQAVAPQLRAKGAGAAVALLLEEDAVAGTLRADRLTRWGARRLFDRLESLGAARELTGRTAFKLYGL